jgi:hypothetical protein
MDRAHYLRFARALALAVVVPGCTGTGPTPDPNTLAETDAQSTTPVDASAAPDAASDVDAGLPFSSGPIVPPELPEALA